MPSSHWYLSLWEGGARSAAASLTPWSESLKLLAEAVGLWRAWGWMKPKEMERKPVLMTSFELCAGCRFTTGMFSFLSQKIITFAQLPVTCPMELTLQSVEEFALMPFISEIVECYGYFLFNPNGRELTHGKHTWHFSRVGHVSAWGLSHPKPHYF